MQGRYCCLALPCCCAWGLWCLRPLASDDAMSPTNTMNTAAHCAGSSGFLFQTTLMRMLKNLRVVQTSVFTKEPKVLMVRKMNSCSRMGKRLKEGKR